MKDHAPSMLKSTAIGGGAAGILASLPLVNALNCCCCLLVMSGGFLAAYLYSNECKKIGSPFTMGNGATVGLVAGLFYTLVFTVVGGLLALVGPSVAESMDGFIEQIEAWGVDVPPEMIDAMESVAGWNPLWLVIVGFFFWLLIAAIFSTIGGVIGGSVFKAEPAPPSPPPAGPTYDAPTE